MGFFDRWKISSLVPQQKGAVGSEDIWRELYGAALSKAGARVNWKTGLEFSTALACARVIADGLAQVPWKVYRAQGEKREVAIDHPLHPLLTVRPNPWQTAYELHEMIGLHLVFAGNAYAFINRNERGRIVELLPFEPQLVTVKRETTAQNETALRYRITFEEGGRGMDVPAANMWHLRGPSWNGWMGLEGVKLAREAIGLGLATEEHGARLFQQGAIPGSVLSADKVLNKEQREELRESWQALYGGGSNAFRTAVIWGGVKWEIAGQHNDEAQFLETRRFQVEEICRAFRVMPIMVGYSDKASTYASAEQMFLAHLVHTMGPWYARTEQSADANLLTPRDREQGYYTKHVVNALMRGTARDRAEFYARMYGIGALNPNEIRALEEMNPYEGGERWRVPLNMQDASAEPPPEEPEKPSAPPAEEE